MSGALWRVECLAVAEHAEAVEDALSAALGEGMQASARMQQGEAWLVQVLCDRRPAGRALRAALTAGGLPATSLWIAPLANRDWVAEGLRQLPPVQSGRMRVLGSHHPAPRTGPIELLIDAGPAFGTGQHQTTRGCLLALDRLARTMRPRTVLDLGCGTGVLAMAAARLWRGVRPRLLASDIDPVSVAEAGRNFARNGLPAIRGVAADGLGHPALRRAAPYNLIVANILALPLIRLAAKLRRVLAPGGVVVLSGLLEEQEPAVRNAYRAAGFMLIARIRLPAWPTLVLRLTPRDASARSRSRPG
jgi:ribosomal protein L11 methyltransferase